MGGSGEFNHDFMSGSSNYLNHGFCPTNNTTFILSPYYFLPPFLTSFFAFSPFPTHNLSCTSNIDATIPHKHFFFILLSSP